MKTLYIVRHAKSSWEYPDIKDYNRPLKKRGINDAYLVSKELAKQVEKPSVFVSSFANRALHTAMIFAESFVYPYNHVLIKKSLYNFSDGYLVKTIMALDDEYESAMIFSHEHGISTFINKYGNKEIDLIPTSGVVCIQFDIPHWKNLKKGKTILTLFPRDLKKS
jgi:phosphohistidine phosphatase